jgi:cysteine desulfurase
MAAIYLDYNATTPIHPEVVQAMQPYLESHFGNPSSSHAYGQRTASAVLRGREEVAELLGATSAEITFTSGGTEANNLALIGVTRALRKKGNHIVSTVVEHPAVTEVLSHLEGEGWEVTRVSVDGTGKVDPQAIRAALTERTVLVSVMHANNEVGTLMDLPAIAAELRPRGIIFHSDAAQSVGKIPTLVNELGVDLLTVAGHKLYGPKGVGALYVRKGTPISHITFGAGQESGLRPGTENVPYIVGLGRACALAKIEMAVRTSHVKTLRDRLHASLCKSLCDGEVRLNGHPEERLPNTLNISFRGVDGAALLATLEPDVAASAGAACHANEADSSVLGAMKIPAPFRNGAIRLSTGRLLTVEDLDRASQAIIRAVQQQGQSSDTA